MWAQNRRRMWLFRLTLMILAPALFLGLLEAGLRLGGYGYPTTFFLGPDANGTYRDNPQYGWRFFPPAIARRPSPCLVSAKPAGTIRILILGSSAAKGVPETSVGFGRILEVLLRDRYPDVKFEVVNAAMTAINSHVVLQIARDCAAQQPDLFVVYMGNNEVVGPFGPGTIFQQWSQSLKFIRASIWVRTTRIGQLLNAVVQRARTKNETPASWQGMEMFLGNQVAADDPRLESVYGSFRQNLLDICGVGRRAGAAVVLSTVAVNLRDCPPFASQHRGDLSPEQLAKWESAYRAGVDLEAKGRCGDALKEYERAAQIDDRFAELQYRLGRCLAELGHPVEARDRFVLARDLDVLRFRADSRINAAIRAVAAEEETLGVCGADAEKTLADSNLAHDGIAGNELFYEHVHLTFDGNYLLARAVMQQVEKALPQLASSRKTAVILSRKQCAEYLALTPWDEYQMARQILEMTSRPPFTGQLEHSARQAASQSQVESLRKQVLAPRALEAVCGSYEAALEKAPDDWLLHYRYGEFALASGRFQIAAEQLRIVLEKIPWESVMHNELGSALRGCGQLHEAITHFRKALKINPSDATTHNNLGNALSSLGQTDEAIECFQKVLEIDPKSVIAYNNIGAVYSNRGQIDQAIAQFEKALEIEPQDARAHDNLGKSLSMQKRTDEAITHLRKALEIDPNLASAHFNLGNTLADCRQVDKAIVHFRRAVELEPMNPLAHNNLGTVLIGRGKLDEAIAQFREALGIDPANANARSNLARAQRLRAGGTGETDPK
jgi:tetratricopeptide (TPR) repeat protein